MVLGFGVVEGVREVRAVKVFHVSLTGKELTASCQFLMAKHSTSILCSSIFHLMCSVNALRTASLHEVMMYCRDCDVHDDRETWDPWELNIYV